MIDHLTLPVREFQKSRSFYEATLAPLGYTLLQCIENEEMRLAGFGTDDTAASRDFWIREEPEHGSGSRYCIAFRAPSKEAVATFYGTALKNGGSDNGAPGYRPEYGRGYYAAFVFDPDGYNIEAVWHDRTAI